MQFFVILFWLLFIVINYKIVLSDISQKTIPNIYLIFLWFLALIGVILWIIPWYNGIFFISIFLTFIIWFSLYCLWFLSAGDIKYILILTLFIPDISIITFMVNTSLITFIYLLWFFCYLFFVIGIFYQKDKTPYTRLLWNNINGDIITWKNANNSIKYWFIPKLLWVINIFLAIFICIRLLRTYILENIPSSYVQNITPEQTLIIIAILLGVSILLIRKVWGYIWRKYESRSAIIHTISIFILIALLVNLLWYWYRTDYFWLIENLYTIMTLYIGIFLLIKWFIYLYKFSLIEMELLYILPKDLRKGDIVSKDFIKNFIIPLLEHKDKKDLDNKKQLEIIRGIRNNISSEQVQALQHIYKKENIQWGVWILPTTAFSYFILGWFFMTILLENYVIDTLTAFILKLL